jgi:eukaryotic-like serine/threonine-protein kinase
VVRTSCLNDGDVRPARPVLDTPIEYPEHARRAGVEGTVVLSLLIDEMGQLMRCEVKSGNKDLAQALLKAVQHWRFEPQLVNGRPEASHLSLTIEFKLNESPRFR